MGDRYLKILMGTLKCCFQLENFFFKKIVEGSGDVEDYYLFIFKLVGKDSFWRVMNEI